LLQLLIRIITAVSLPYHRVLILQYHNNRDEETFGGSLAVHGFTGKTLLHYYFYTV